MSTKISIVIPVFNSSKTIKNTLNSVINQSFSNYEVICINDGSTDNTKEIIEEMMIGYSNIRLYNQSNSGVSSARNFGIEKSTGEYVLFLDGDDFLKEDYLEKFAKYFGKYDVIKGLLNDGKEIQTNYINHIVNFDFISKQMAINSVFNYSTGQIIKRKVLIEKNIRFDEGITFGEDLLFNYYLYKQSNSVLIIDNPGYIYIPNEYSYTNNYTLDKVKRKCIDLKEVYSQMGYDYYINICWYKICINLKNYISINNTSYSAFKQLFESVYDSKIFGRIYKYKSVKDTLLMNILVRNRLLYFFIIKYLKKLKGKFK